MYVEMMSIPVFKKMHGDAAKKLHFVIGALEKKYAKEKLAKM